MIRVLIKALKDKCIVVQCVEERQYIFISIQEYMLHFEILSPKIYIRDPQIPNNVDFMCHVTPM